MIVGGGIFFGYLGYKLFIFGVEKGSAKVSAKSKFVSVMFSGTAPGLFFMAAGCAVLLISLFMRMDVSPSVRYWWAPNNSAQSDATNYWQFPKHASPDDDYRFHVQYSYDTLYRLTRLLDTNWNALTNLRYSYDEVGRRNTNQAK